MSKSLVQKQIAGLFDYYSTWAKVAEATGLTTLTLRNVSEGKTKTARAESAASIEKAFAKIEGKVKEGSEKVVKATKISSKKSKKAEASSSVSAGDTGLSRLGFVNFGLALAKVPLSTQESVCGLLAEAKKCGLTLRDLLEALRGHIEERAAKSVPVVSSVAVNGVPASA